MNADAPNQRDEPAPRERMHPADWTVVAGAVDDVLTAMSDRLRRRRRNRRAAAAGAGMTAVAVVMWWWIPARTVVPTAAETPESAVVIRPEQRALPDGSTVELRAGAELDIEYTPAQRRVVLRSGGAHFQVEKSSVPFVVRTGGVDVRAVGTAFSVHLDSAEVEVLVTEGRVSVESATAAAASTESASALDLQPEQTRTVLALADAGSRVVVPRVTAPRAAELASLDRAELARRLAWRAAQLDFSRTPLSDVLRLIDLHTPPQDRVRIRLANPANGRLELSGTLRSDNLDMLFLLLKEEHGIVSERQPDGTIVLR